MGIATRDKSSDLSNDKNAFIVPPVFPGLLAWAYLGGSIEKSIRNLAFGQPGFTAVGNPEVHPNFLRFKGGSDFLRTSVFQRRNHTIFCVVRSNDTFVDPAHTPMFIGTFSGQNVELPAKVSHGFSLFIVKNDPGAPMGKMTAQAGVFNPNAPDTTLPLSVNIVKDVSVFSLISLTCSDTHVSVRDWTTGQTAINPFPTGFIPGLSNRAFAVGGPALETQNLQGTNDVAAFTIYEGVMTEGQQALTAARFRAFCDGVGIPL
ncbi:hypothetical protein SME10J_44590 [Serratia marcescens]|nr:hypothetical protein SME10J_44590 [Serratia marcescens]BEN49508.1 hypothetical protein SMKC057_16200 [Serratia marcescens]